MGRPEPLPRILGDLAARETTGCLVVRAGVAERQLYLKKGRLVQATSKLAEEALGPVMVQQGRLSPAQLESALEQAGAQGRQLGEILISEGHLTPTEVVEALTEQVRVRVFNTFRLSDFEHELRGGVSGPAHFTVSLRIPLLVIEGISIAYSVDRILDELELTEETRVNATADAVEMGRRLQLGPREFRLLQRVQQNTSIEDLLMQGDVSYLSLLRFLFALWCLRLIEVTGSESDLAEVASEPEPEPAPPPTAPPAAAGAGAGTTTLLDVDDPGDARRAAVRRQLLERYRKVSPELTPQTPQARAAASARGTAEPRKSSVEDQVIAAWLKLPRQDYFEVLGISERARESDIKIAFGGLLRRLHLETVPDDWSEKGKRAARETLDRITEAYTVLLDPEQCRQYIDQRRKKGALTLEGDPQMITAGVALQKASRLQERGDLAGARDVLEVAIGEAPEQPGLHVALGAVLAELTIRGANTAGAAASILRKAVSLDPSREEPWVWLGRIARAKGQHERAAKLFHKALSINPRSDAAGAELRALRQHAKKGSLLHKLLGK